jgi:hypothetical protein
MRDSAEYPPSRRRLLDHRLDEGVVFRRAGQTGGIVLLDGNGMSALDRCMHVQLFKAAYIITIWANKS